MMQKSERHGDNPQGTLNVTDVELGWLAGMIDGEGAVAFSVYYRTEGMNTIRVKPQIIVSGTDKAMIERVADIVERLGVGVHFQTREQRFLKPAASSLAAGASKYRDLHLATVAGFKRVMKLLSIVNLHLTSTKREKGEMMLQYMTARLEKTARHGRWATHDADDLRLMLKIMRFSTEHSVKSAGAKYTVEIERLLRDITQSGHPDPRASDDVVRPAGRPVEGQRRGGPASPRVFGGVSKLLAS